ncbi:MAG: nicotinate-nucleotide adenylyltransferase [Ruminiclostridium sp.]|nr:nicotinate-nucleotide adenylyltransferase [Ruminiclostridium sp.]
MSKIGILGGTFDPPHIGHISLAQQAKSELKLSEVLVIPAYRSPFKADKASPYKDRFEMTRLAFEGMEGFAVSDIEKKLGGTSYTINTLRALKEIYPQKTEFYFIIGGDQLFTIEKWYRYEAILKECHVTAVTRGGISYTDMQEYANELGRIRVLNLDIPDVSSHEIRAMAAAGEDISALVPPAAAVYIGTEGLYRG